MAAIEVRGLTKRYGSIRALDGIDFAVDPGEIFALLGPNGAGKTTAVEILEGHRRPDAGEIAVLGEDPQRGGAGFRERIGIVLQTAGLEEELSSFETVSHFGACYPHPRPADEVLELVGLGDRGDARVQTLSHGQRRRLDLALALVGNPEVLFLDEPTTGFDPAARRGAWRLIADLKRSGVTVLLTTHYMEEAQILADRVAVITRGRIAALGPPTALGADGTEIRFRVPEGADVPRLARELGVVRHEGRDLVVSTSEPTRALHGLTCWAVSSGRELEGLMVRRATLEDVYLRLTQEGERDG